MWPKSYKDYPKDTPLIQNRVEPGKGIIGCEMSEPNGWGESFHTTKVTPKNSNNGNHHERTHTQTS